MRPRRQSLLSHGLSPYNIATSHATREQSPLGHGLSLYKKAKEQIFLREQVPDKICFFCFFAWLVAFGNLCLTRWVWG